MGKEGRLFLCLLQCSPTPVLRKMGEGLIRFFFLYSELTSHLLQLVHWKKSAFWLVFAWESLTTHMVNHWGTKPLLKMITVCYYKLSLAIIWLNGLISNTVTGIVHIKKLLRISKVAVPVFLF